MTIAEQLSELERRITAAAARAGRSSNEIRIVAATKFQPVEVVQEYIDIPRGPTVLPLLGESYVQEFKRKREVLSGKYSCHLIGALQRNKAKLAVQLFDVIESLHTADVARAVHAAAEGIQKRQDVLLEVNISRDPGKAGFMEEEVMTFVNQILPDLRSLRCLGLMTITQLYPDSLDVRRDYAALAQLLDHLKPRLSSMAEGMPLELSMGMSEDFEIAVEEGATIVRIGTALFGGRERKG